MMSAIAALFFFKNPFSACVGFPSASYAAFTGEPFTSSSRSLSRRGMCDRKKMMRRGVLFTTTGLRSSGRSPRSSVSLVSCWSSVACAASCIHAGISSVSSSKKYSAIGRLQQRKSERFPRGQELVRTADGQLADALDDPHALRHRDRAAGVERVEHVRALQRPVVCGKDELRIEAAFRFCLVHFEKFPVQTDVRRLEVVLRKLVLVLLPHGAVAETGAPFDVVDRRLAREEHRQALDAIRDLGGDRREVDAAGLLEVCELRDLHAVEEDLPPHAPRAEGGRLPVVLLEANVVAGQVESECAQRVEIQLLHVERRRLEDDLKLVVLAEAERIVAVAPVGGTA